MRKSILAIPVFAAAAALAASHAESTTYVDGNLTGVSPNSGATMVSDDQQLTLRTGLANVSVPYDKISHAELGAVKENSQSGPFYKFWAHKSKPQTQLLIVNFKGTEGEDKSMTLELARPAAASMFESIESHNKAAVAGSAPVKMAQNSSKTTSTKSDKPKEMKEDEIVRSGKDPDGWWGDNVWKTKNNTDKWNKTTATANGSDQRQQ